MVYFHVCIGFLIFSYLAYRLIWPLRSQKILAAGLLVLLALGAFKFPMIRLLGGARFFAPELPGWCLHFAGFLYGWVLFCFALMVVAELGRGVWFLYCRKSGRKGLSQKGQNILHGVVAGTALVFALAALWGGTRAPDVREIPLYFANLPESAEGLRVAVLSDIHVSPTVRKARVQEFVRRTNATRADLILILGDFLDGTVEELREDIAPLGDLSAPLGVWAVTGNHEYYYNYPEWRKMFQLLGIRMLENQWTNVQGIRLAGITDPAGRKFGEPVPDLKKALAGGKKYFTILLAHRPKYAVDAAKLGVDLQLSGHTHGGSIWGLKPFVKRYNAGFVAGRYQVGDMTLLVSNGTGIWNGMPLRLGAPAEILLLELHKNQ